MYQSNTYPKEFWDKLSIIERLSVKYIERNYICVISNPYYKTYKLIDGNEKIVTLNEIINALSSIFSISKDDSTTIVYKWCKYKSDIISKNHDFNNKLAIFN